MEKELSLSRLALIAPFVAGLATFLVFVYVRDWPALLALVIGAAVMALGFVVARTWERLRNLGDR